MIKPHELQEFEQNHAKNRQLARQQWSQIAKQLPTSHILWEKYNWGANMLEDFPHLIPIHFQSQIMKMGCQVRNWKQESQQHFLCCYGDHRSLLTSTEGISYIATSLINSFDLEPNQCHFYEPSDFDAVLNPQNDIQIIENKLCWRKELTLKGLEKWWAAPENKWQIMGIVAFQQLIA